MNTNADNETLLKKCKRFFEKDTAITVKSIANHVLCFGNWTTIEGTIH